MNNNYLIKRDFNSVVSFAKKWLIEIIDDKILETHSIFNEVISMRRLYHKRDTKDVVSNLLINDYLFNLRKKWNFDKKKSNNMFCQVIDQVVLNMLIEKF